MLELNNVSYRYEGAAQNALSGVTMTIEAGEMLAIVGHNGSGKSTLAKHLNGLLLPTGGNVTIDGMDTKNEDALLAIRQRVGMVFQNPDNQLVTTIVEEDVGFGPENLGVPPKEIRGRVDAALESVGMTAYADKASHALSGGQKQRIAIARALATNPKVLLCDEATSALDPTTTQSILTLIKELNARLGVTVLVITHEMRVVEQICNRVAIISDSRISEIGSVEDVFRHPKTEAAKRLLFPEGRRPAAFHAAGPLYRIVFDGNSAEKPIVADMILQCGAPVNIVFADTKVIDGRMYGQMLLQLPDDPGVTARMLAYLEGEYITFGEER